MAAGQDVLLVAADLPAGCWTQRVAKTLPDYRRLCKTMTGVTSAWWVVCCWEKSIAVGG